MTDPLSAEGTYTDSVEDGLQILDPINGSNMDGSFAYYDELPGPNVQKTVTQTEKIDSYLSPGKSYQFVVYLNGSVDVSVQDES